MRLSAAQTSSVESAGRVKAALVEFALSPPFQKQLRRIARELAEQAPHVADPGVEVVERLLFSFTYDDGSTIVDRFLRRRGLSAADQAMARGFLDGVHSFFEVVTGIAPEVEVVEVFEVRCCLSDLRHIVAPTQTSQIPELPAGSFLAGRLNPIAGTELWTPSGTLEVISAQGREAVAKAVLEMSMRSPGMTHRNPERLQQAIDRVAETHRAFLARHGSDLLLVAGKDLPDLFAEAMMPTADKDAETLARSRARLRESIETSELIHDDQVLLYSHPVAGIGFYRDFEAVARALEAGADAADGDVKFLRGYLDDPSVPAWLLRRIVTDRLPAAQSAVAKAVGRPEFDWDLHGEDLLASLPGDKEPKPTLAIVPSISAGDPVATSTSSDRR